MSAESGKLVRIATALGAAEQLVYDWDLEAGHIEWYGPPEALLGFETLASTSGGFNALIHPEDLPRRLEALARQRESGGPLDCCYRLRVADGGFRWVRESAAPAGGIDAAPARLVGLLRGVDAPAADGGTEGARRDRLTGHRSRGALRDALAEAIGRSVTSARAGAYLAIDIDNLAMVNDAFGYAAGDAVIAEIGARLGRLLRGRDVIGRVDGDGFGLLLEHCDEEGLAVIADRLIRALRQMPIDTPAGVVAATVSLGGVVFPAAARSADDVMTRADIALQQAKRAGRNHFVLYRLSEAQRRAMRRGNGVAREVQHALAEGRLVLAYQPVVGAGSADPAFHECLLRLRRADGEIVAAGQFVPVIEQLGLMRQIDRRVLELAVGELARDPNAVLAVNISGLTVGDPAWLQDAIRHLGGQPGLAARLIIELTETAAFQEFEESARFVAEVRDLGCRVALDDFGAGYSSFRHLRSLPVDIVKIDGSFVRGIGERSENLLFLRSLLGLAGAFGLTTVAECVESADEARVLAREGVTYLQGWHFGRPEFTRSATATAPVPVPRRTLRRRPYVGRAG